MSERKMSTAKLLKKFIPYYGKHLPIFVLDLLCAAFSTMADLVLPILLRFLTNSAKDGLLNFETVLKIALLFLALRVFDTIANFFMQNVGHVMGAKIETDMRYDAFSHIQQLPYSYFNTHKSGQILARITTDLFDVTEFSHHCPEEFFIGFIKFILSFIILSKIHLPMTVVIFIMLPIMLITASKYNRFMRKHQKKQRFLTGEINSGVENNILGAKVVKSFANEDYEIEKFQVENEKFLGIKKKFYLSFAGMQVVYRIFDGIMYLIVIIYGGYLMLKGMISPSDMFIYTLYISMLLATAKRLIEFMELFQKGMTGLERFVEIMEVKNDILDSPDAIDLENVKGEIEFKNVSFKYPDGDRYILKDLNFKINKGEHIAFVGSSGAGKTTIANLIPRFYDVSKGAITLDGRDIRDIKQKSLRENIGIVEQDVYLFSGTVRENISYGKICASDEEIIEASKMAGAYEFIIELPDGFDTHIGERGTKLSGGQKQRLSIARVFLKNPPILILDEATSALDNQSEAIVQKSLEDLQKGRTTITIAHRLTTIESADRIMVLTEEGIEEEGTHQELLEMEGIYYDLYHKNFEEEDGRDY